MLYALWLLTLCAGVWVAPVSKAADGAGPITIVISKPNEPADLTRTPINTFVIDADTLNAHPTVGVQNLMMSVPTLFADRGLVRGGRSSVYLRGGDPNLTVVRIDGVQVNNPTNSRGGSFDLSALDAVEVERIEVLSGPLSALFGSDAMAGAVNITTSQAAPEPRVDIQAGLGEDSHKQVGVHATGPIDDEKHHFYSISARHTDAGEPIEGDTFDSAYVSSKYSYRPAPDAKLSVGMRHQEYQATTFPDDSGGPELAVFRDVDEIDADSSVLYSAYNWTGHVMDYDLNLNAYRTRQDTVSPGVAPGRRDPFGIPANSVEDEYARYEFLFNATAAGENLTTTLGLDARHESADSRGEVVLPDNVIPTAFDLERTTIAAVAGARYDLFQGASLHGALRYTDPERFDPEVIPTLGLLFQPDGMPVALKVTWGEGFKLPSFYALGNPIVGNPDLRPERSNGVELGVDYRFSSVASISISAFETHFKNLVDFDATPPPQLVNRSEVNTHGGEIVLRITPLPTLTSMLYLSYTDTDIRNSDERLRNRPRYRAGLNMKWTARPDLTLNADVRFVDRRLDSSIPTGDQELEAFTRVDISGRWRVADGWFLSASVDNLFNEDYQDAIGFPAPSTRWRLSIRYRH